MSVTVRKAGMFTTLQDAGRTGHRDVGVPVSGAMDRLACDAANALVGNDGHEAVLEMTQLGPVLKFHETVLAALCGGDFEASLDGVPVESWRCFRAEAGSVLRIGRAKGGMRGYLAVRGGFAVEPVLGSRSTFVRGGFGGLAGRRLEAGDRLKVGEAGVQRAETAWKEMRVGWQASHDLRAAYAARPATLRCLEGPEADWFREEARSMLYGREYVVSVRSDRMGVRLQGQSLPAPKQGSMLSEAACPGIVQVPPDGNPIVLGADAQTTGGYPRIATVALVDLPLLAQAKPGDLVRFRRIDAAEATALWRARQRELALLREAVRLKLGSRACLVGDI